MAERRYVILLIEDNLEDRETYRRLLGRLGGAEYTFLETDSGEEALRLWRTCRPDCVLLDYRLPDADGLELLAEMTAAAPAPVVMLTSQGDETLAVRAMKSGAQDYLVKGRMTAAELAGAVHNAIDKVELRQRVAKAQERFRLAVEASPSAMLLVDSQGRVVLANAQAERLFAYPRDELLGWPVEMLLPQRSRLFHPEHRGGFAPGPAARLMSRGQELYARRKDGTEFPAEVALTPLETDEGPMVLASVVDVTERKRLEEEQRRLERRVQESQRLESLGVLAGGVAHRFNNLLVGIMGNASLAREMVPGESPARPALEGIEHAAQQAAELCGQMLSFSGRGRFVVEPVDLSRAIEAMKPLLEVTAAGGAALHSELTPDLPAIEVDAAQLRQLVLNLVSNAVDATDNPTGVITITTGARRCGPQDWAEAHQAEDLPAGLYVYLQVRDRGCGMERATLGRIFEPFFTTKFTGRGLGLAAVLGIVRGHRGAIQVESAPGQGATFRVFFPASGSSTTAAPTPAASRGTASTVLVVDDEAMVREVTATALQKVGLEVLTAAGGQEAIEIVRARGREIGVVLLDLVMAGIGGEETLKELRRLRPQVRVLGVSGYPESEATPRVGGQGLDGFIQKPWRAAALVAEIRRLLAEAR
jgi:PAS domain S-box-containing protein